MKRLIIATLLFMAGTAVRAQVAITAVYVSASTASTATINWTTSGPATSQVKYGTDASLPYANAVDRNLITSHSMTLILLNASQLYYFAPVSVDNAGHTTQGATMNFSLCGQPLVPLNGTVNNYYEYGTYTLTWIPPSGAPAVTPMVCGQSMSTTLTGRLSGGASLSASMADSYKVIPGPGTWQIAVTDAGNISPISVTYPVSAQNSDVSELLQTAAASAGLTAVIANLNDGVVYPPFVCTATNGECASGGSDNPIPCTSTIVFSATATTNYLSLTCNVLSSTIPSGAAGKCTTIQVKQGGAFTLAWPATMHGTFTPLFGVGTFDSGQFCWAVSDSAWVANGAAILHQ